MRGKDAVSLEKAFSQRFLEIERLTEVTKNQAMEINKMKEVLARTANKVGIVKYDAFPEVGGKLSFALAMLDDSNTGFVLNAIHSRDGCYTYVKEIMNAKRVEEQLSFDLRADVDGGVFSLFFQIRFVHRCSICVHSAS